MSYLKTNRSMYMENERRIAICYAYTVDLWLGLSLSLSNVIDRSIDRSEIERKNNVFHTGIIICQLSLFGFLVFPVLIQVSFVTQENT